MIQTTATELPRLMNCIGSYYMPSILPADTDREAAEEGNAAHWLAKMRFDGRAVAVGQQAPNGHIITDEMSEHVDDYLAILDCGEMEIDTSYGSATAAWDIHGRADHISWRCHPNDQHETPFILNVDDFKYGYRYVEVVENWTLISHAIGWCIRNNATPHTIVFRIIQPRCYSSDGPVREWKLSYVDLMDRYRQISERLTDPVDELTTGVEWCAKCHALPNCAAARRAGMNAVDASHIVFDERLPNEVLAWERETLVTAQETIKNRLAALDELMTHKIKGGEVLPGYVIEQRYANSRWKGGVTGKMLTALTGVDCVKDGTVTPAEAERRGVPKSVVKSMTERPSIGTKLKRVDVDAIARKVFG